MKKTSSSLLVICLSLAPFLVCAEDSVPGGGAAQSVTVEVRTVEASDPLPQLPQSEAVLINVAAQLDDLRPQLQKLHYRSFKLLGVQSQVVQLLQKGTLVLVNGHSLTVRPLYVSSKRIGLWLKWRDNTGVEVLDTRMHFDPGESMLAGTESEGRKGVVLAIDVKPVR